MSTHLNWTPRPPVTKKSLEGRFVRLEPLEASRHGDELYEAMTMADSADRFRYMFERSPIDRKEFEDWLQQAEVNRETLFFAVIDKRDGRVAGRQGLMRTVAQHGVTEIGNILWSSTIARTPATTEAVYLFACYVFDELGYRRFEWKCDNQNEPSKRSALRLGFKAEGVHRQHMVIKDLNRDTAWFSILDSEWPACKQAFEVWLAVDNFDEQGAQIRRLEDIREGLAGMA